MVNVTYQNNGSRWLIILNGTRQEIEEKFNSFWNLRATSGELDWNGEFSACFWSSPTRLGGTKESIWDYFYNFHVLHTITDEMEADIRARAEAHVQKRMKGVITNKDYRAKVRNLRKRLLRTMVSDLAQRDFDAFKKNNGTDWNQSFLLQTPELPSYRMVTGDEIEREDTSDEIVEA